MTESGKVVLVGAGPGDPGLITVRGAEVLRQADAVVYDYLASPELLKYVPPSAEVRYVGKKSGQHTLSQDEINQLLIELASAGKLVVRLKGGDPFVFGRGGEEAVALAEAGIPFEVVPGVTSAISVPAYAGIPVTHRGMASSLAIVTGHEDPGKAGSMLDWQALARMDTLVILMGVSHLPLIVEALLRSGKAAETPTAAVEWGTLGTQRTVTGTLGTILARTRDADLRAPAVLVVGEVVRLRETLSWFERKPLHGLRVLVTRTREQAGKLSERLRALGAEPVECALIETVPPEDPALVDAAIARVEAYDWIVFTSANGVAFFFDRLEWGGRDARALARAKIAAIGPATAEALREQGLRADVVPDEFVAEEVAAAMGAVKGLRVLLPRAEKARPELARRLREGGAEVDEVVTYRTVQPAELRQRLWDVLQEVDAVTFTSSSTVRHFVEALPKDRAEETLARLVVACIGPVTASTACELGLCPSLVAESYTIDGLVETLVRWRLSSKNGVALHT